MPSPTISPKIAFLASGSGSNCEAIWAHLSEVGRQYQGLLICNKPQALVLQRATKYQIPSIVLSDKSYTSPAEYHHALLENLKQFNPNYIVCAGYLKILDSKLVAAFNNKIVNIHPSLLPAFKGLHAIQQAYEYGVKVTGITIHLVNEDLDAGKILLQKSIEIFAEESLDQLTERIHKLEHQHYPKFVADWCFK